MRPGTSNAFSLHEFAALIAGLVAALALVMWCVRPPHVGAQASADTPTLRVQVLSGKTGRPVTNAHLKLFRDSRLDPLGGGHDNKVETTDGEGYAPIPDVDTSVPEVFIAVDLHVPCSKTGKHDFPLLKVRAAGVVSENACRPRISMFPQQGTLIFYVRDETFLEKLRH